MVKWSGDHQFQLPQNMAEPYRLWFYALKLAHRVEGLEINKDFYKEWGDVEGEDFTSWWTKHWRKLFAVSIGVREIVDDEDFHFSSDNDSMIVRIPLNQPWSKTERELKAILKTQPETDRELGKFYITGSNRFDRKAIRLNLMVYEYQLNGYNLLDTCVEMTKWYDDWKAKKREVTYPKSLYNLGKTILRGESVATDTSDYRSAYRIRLRGKKIVMNVANGQFPGKYS